MKPQKGLITMSMQICYARETILFNFRKRGLTLWFLLVTYKWLKSSERFIFIKLCGQTCKVIHLLIPTSSVPN